MINTNEVHVSGHVYVGGICGDVFFISLGFLFVAVLYN